MNTQHKKSAYEYQKAISAFCFLRLKMGKYMVINVAPGQGKTYCINLTAEALVGQKIDGKPVRVCILTTTNFLRDEGN